MGKTNIEWADAVWNPVTGCTWEDDPFRVSLWPNRMDEPLGWRKSKRVFVCSMGDLFHQDVPPGFIMQIFDTMACATIECGKRHKHEEECWTGDPHTFLLLTKRPERMLKWFTEEMPRLLEFWSGNSPATIAMGADHWPLPNVHLGVSVENQATADERIPLLLQTPAARRFVSIEPMLGPVNISQWDECDQCGAKRKDFDPHNEVSKSWTDWKCYRHYDPLGGCDGKFKSSLDQVILGGETGPGARPMHPDWARKVRDDCKAAGVPFFFKSPGEWVVEYDAGERGLSPKRSPLNGPGKPVYHRLEDGTPMIRVGKKAAGHLLDGKEHREI